MYLRIRFLVFCFILVTIKVSGAAYLKVGDPITNNMILQRDRPALIWGEAEPGSNVFIEFDGKKYKTPAQENGYWEVYLDSHKADGKPYFISIYSDTTICLNNILFGDVWLAGGQSNMEWPMKKFDQEDFNEALNDSDYPNWRVFVAHKGKKYKKKDNGWVSMRAEIMKDFSAVAYHFGKTIYQSENIPIGIISCNLGGTAAETWISPQRFIEDKSLSDRKLIFIRDTLRHGASHMYNRLLSRVIPFTLKGIIFYQGESNGVQHADYEYVFSSLISDWREKFRDSHLPFIYAQISTFEIAKDTLSKIPTWAYIREAQLNILDKFEHVRMTVTADAGQKNKIHPFDKKTVGTRMALQAQEMVYGRDVISSGPIYDSSWIVQDTVFISFKNADNGLMCAGDKVTPLEICSINRMYHDASTTISNNILKVWSPLVKKPVSVRYAFYNWCEPNLYNVEGLPASPFRTNSSY